MITRKGKVDLLNKALYRLQETTPITAIAPGSVARSLSELVIEDISDLYKALDHSTAMAVISTATGRALDLLGQLYGMSRKTLSDYAAENSAFSSFIFYLDAPHTEDIVIPPNTKVMPRSDSRFGRGYTYHTVDEVTLPAGRVRVFARIRPLSVDPTFTAGRGEITRHDLTHPGVILKCTNLEPISVASGMESDENFRARITQEVRRSAGGTITALRFSALAVPFVRDVRVYSGHHGLGSVRVVVVPEVASDFTSVMNRAKEAIAKVAPVGVRVLVTHPDYEMLRFIGSVKVDPDHPDNKHLVARIAEDAVGRYLNTLLPDDTLVLVHMMQSIMDASNAIKDISIRNYQINDVELHRSNYTPREGGQILPGEIKITPA